MDPPDDLSARVLLRHIQDMEPPRTPINSGEDQAPSDSPLPSGSPLQHGRLLRSSKTQRESQFQSPQNIVRRSLRQKIHQSITRKSLLATKRRTPSIVLRKHSVSTLSPRQLLKLIQETGPVMSPLVHESATPAELQPPSADPNPPSLQSSIELSGLDLSDPSMEDVSIQKGLSRKRPRRSLNVTAFQKLLKDAAKKRESSAGDNSSLSPSSSTSLGLQSPFDADAEKSGIQRKVPHRRRTSGRSFNAAMNKQQITDVSSHRLSAQNIAEDANFEGLTLALSKLSETDIMNCHTTLYDPQGAVDSSLSVLAAQDKPTASTCQEETQEERGEMAGEKSVEVFSGEDGAATDECVPGSHEKGKDDVNKTEAEDSQPNDDRADGFLTFEIGVRDESEEEEAAVEPQAEEGEAAVEPQAEDEGMDPSQTEEEAVADSQSEEEGVAAGARTEDEGESESRAENVVVLESQCDVEEPQAAEDASGLQTNDEAPQEEEWEEEELERDTRHVGHRAYRSEGGLVMPVTEAREDPTDAAGSSEIGSKGLGALGSNTSLEASPSQMGTPEEPEPSLQERLENEAVGRKSSSFHLVQVSHDAEACERQSDGGDAPAEDAAEQQEEWADDDDDEEDTHYEELPDKTPAFVKQKRIFLASNPPPLTLHVENVQASSSSEALPKAKQKQVRRKKTEAVLPKTCLMSVFKHFAKTKVSADVFPALNNVMDKFLDRLSLDLETYAAHAKRKTITVDDVKLLLRRQGYINDKMPVEVLIEKYLRMEQRRILIPIATSGNVVVPKIKKCSPPLFFFFLNRQSDNFFSGLHAKKFFLPFYLVLYCI
uniref:Centromere protein T n=1 Tax=Fundulus heteroclitus TaxID=8078 RepID=A0A3Q2QGB9_FUNHE